jgi:deazaflavin-dependent oxidoreductase (nitroreductase family)
LVAGTTLKDATARRLSRFHTAILRISRGRIGRRVVDNDMLLLTTHGRRSGRPHTVPLLYLRDGDDFLVIASWGGRDYHPDWYLNLMADPNVDVGFGGATRPVTARTTIGEERAAWWERAVEAHDGYGRYQSRTDREIPVVRLENVSG